MVIAGSKRSLMRKIREIVERTQSDVHDLGLRTSLLERRIGSVNDRTREAHRCMGASSPPLRTGSASSTLT
jgi:hypothetical protein